VSIIISLSCIPRESAAQECAMRKRRPEIGFFIGFTFAPALA